MASSSRPLTASGVLFAVLVAGAVLALGARAAVTVRDADISDFRCFYEAGRLVAAGSDPYDRTAWAPGQPPRVTGSPGVSSCSFLVYGDRASRSDAAFSMPASDTST